VAYVVVSSPEALALEEARFFADHLVSEGMHPDALVINRVRAPLEADAGQVAYREAVARGVPFEQEAVARVQAILDEERALGAREQERIAGVPTGVPKGRTLMVPLFTSDVHEVRALGRIAEHLKGDRGS
jgi:anion-transporting  ArsA/GET3 family ATPase